MESKENDPKVERITADLKRGMVSTRPHTCAAWTVFGEEMVEKTLSRNREAFVLCEYPERRYVRSCVMAPEACRACRTVLIALTNDEPGLQINVSDNLAADMKLRGARRMVRAADVLAFYAETTGDPELVSAVVRLGTASAVVSPRVPQPQH